MKRLRRRGKRPCVCSCRRGTAGNIAAARVNAARGLAHRGAGSSRKAHTIAAWPIRVSGIDPRRSPKRQNCTNVRGPSEGQQMVLQASRTTQTGLTTRTGAKVAAGFELEHDNYGRAARTSVASRTACYVAGVLQCSRSLDLQIRCLAGPDRSESGWRSAGTPRFAPASAAWFWWKTIRLTQALVSSKRRS